MHRGGRERDSFFFLHASKTQMACLSFIGRVLFVSVFLLSLWQQFTKVGEDGDVAAKFDSFSKHVLAQTKFQLPQLPPFEGFEINHLSALAAALKLTGSLLFIFGSTFGAVLLCLHQVITMPILYDFYNYDADGQEFAQLFVKFIQNLSLAGALLYFIGMKNSMPRRQPKKKTAHKAKAM